MKAEWLSLCLFRFARIIAMVVVSLLVNSVNLSAANPVPDWTAEGNQAHARFGWSVSTAGDVIGDGFADMIVGACCYDHDEEDEGMVFVYYGGREKAIAHVRQK